MYSISLRDHLKVAFSLEGMQYGQAQNVHGATYALDVVFYSRELDVDGAVINFSLARQIVEKVVSLYSYKYLDDLAEFKENNATMEYMCRLILEKLDRQFSLIDIPNKTLNRISVSLSDSTLAKATYTKEIAFQ
ncbi:MAG: 6-carboxytetrahydropterin synthase [Candidatus Heimdallarchaeota archaeon]|nr:6-carboxytetrahydropterin synthase [Candidatus Heimdallarchaeota archaeon]